MFARAAIRKTRRLSATHVGSLLFAFACSAPPGTGDDDGDIPEFRGTLGGPGAPATGMPATGAPGVGPSAAPTSGAPTGAGGSSGSEPVGAGVSLNPSPANGASQGAGGSAMVAPAPGTNVGAAGSSMTPAGAGGGSTTPNEGNPDPQTPPQNPPPVTPPPVTPPPSGDCGGQFFCDGFESVGNGASPTAALWTIIDGYAERDESANVRVSSDNARSGAQALRVANTNSRTGIVAALPQRRYFVRAYLMADAVPLGPVFIGLGTDQNSETRLRIQGQSFATINTVGPGDAVRPGAANSGNCPDCVTLRPNQWFCAEFFIDDDTRNAVLWIDGIEAASIVNGEGGWPVQPANPSFFVGSMSVQGGSSGVWIDDVAAGPERIGCD